VLGGRDRKQDGGWKADIEEWRGSVLKGKEVVEEERKVSQFQHTTKYGSEGGIRDAQISGGTPKSGGSRMRDMSRLNNV
jgi:hypothetical protein